MPSTTKAYRSTNAATMRILAAVDLIDRCPDAALRRSLAAALAPTLRAMAAILASDGYPVEIDAPRWPSKVPADLAPVLATLREAITGFLVGAALGLATIVYLLPAIMSITGILLVIAAGMFLASWIAAGDARISYAGFPLALAFLLCTLQADGPSLDLTASRDRVLGVLLGTGMSYLVFTRLWPVSVSGTIDPAIARLVAMLRQVDKAGGTLREGPMAHAMAAVTTLHRSVELASFEPRRLRPASEWIEARHDLLARIDQLESPLLLAQPGSEAALEAVAREAARRAASRPPESVAAVSSPPPMPPAAA